MEGIVNKWGALKVGKGQLQCCIEDDTIGFDLFEWEECQEKVIKSCVCKRQITAVESEMTTDTCMWDSKPKRSKAKRSRRERKTDKKAKTSVKSTNSDLVTELRSLCQQITNAKRRNPKLLQFGDYSLFADDIYNLQYDEWLSDSNISLFYSLIQQSFLTEIKGVCLLPPTFAFLLANHDSPAELKDVMPAEVQTAQVIFCPVNDNIDFDDTQGGSHWSLLVCLPHMGKTFGIDSMRGANETEMRRLTCQLGALLERKFDYRELDTPQQINGSDCGVIVVAITMIYIHRITTLQNNEVVNWSLNLRINALGCRFWMMDTICSLIDLYDKGVQFKH